MSSDNAKKRKWKCQDDASSTAGKEDGERGDSLEAMMAEMKAQIMTSIQSEMDNLKNRLSCVDELQNRCEDLERSVKVLVKSQAWEYSAPFISDSYWTGRGFDEEYVEIMNMFLREIKQATCDMRTKGNQISELNLGDAESPETVLLHDDTLMPHWVELTDAMQLDSLPTANAGLDSHIYICNIQLTSDVLNLLKASLKMKTQFTEFIFQGNDFPNARDGIDFAVQLVQDNPHLSYFEWRNNPINNTGDLKLLVEAINSRSSLNQIHLANCCGTEVNCYEIICSLLRSDGATEEINLISNNIRTMGCTFIPDFIATNPPLRSLMLEKNCLGDNDAILIAAALMQNTTMRRLDLGQNEITSVGRKALKTTVIDFSGLNAVSDSNHFCVIDIVGDNLNIHPHGVNRQMKIALVLNSRHREGANVNHFDSEFGDDWLELVPKVLESVHRYCRTAYRNSAGGRQNARPVSVVHEILRSWRMPELYECHGNGRVSS